MRILRAYKEISTITPTNRNYYDLTMVVKMNVAVTGLALLFACTYNKQKHVVCVYRDGTDNWEDISGSYQDEFIHVIPIKAKKVGLGYYVPGIGELVSTLMSTTLVSNAVASNANTFTIRSHNHTEAYLDFTDRTFNATLVTSMSRAVTVVAEQVEGLSLAAYIDLDIDDKTAIGLNFQAFDFGRPLNPKSNVSNTFTLPRTSINEKLTNSSELLQDGSDTLYSIWYVDYWADSHKHINKARLMVDNITVDEQGGRISCVMYEKASGLDRLKEVSWASFMSNYAIWLTAQMTTEWTNSLGDDYGLQATLDALSVSTEHIHMPFIYGDFHKNNLLTQLPLYEGDADQGGNGQALTTNQWGINGGHICVYIKSIFEYIKERYDLDLMAAPTYSLFERTVESELYIHTRHLAHAINGNDGDGYVNAIVYSSGAEIFNDKPNTDKSTKSVYDFVQMVVKQTNALVDTIGDGTYAVRSLEDIELAPVVDFSGKYQKGFTFYPAIDGIAQNNSVDFSKYSDLLLEGSFKRNIVCNNKNIETNAEFAKIPSFVPPAFVFDAKQALAFYEKGSFAEFTLMVNTATTVIATVQNYGGPTPFEATAKFKLPVIYGLSLSYNKYESIISKPKRFTAKKWLSFEDVRELKFFALYRVDELNGTFFINKIGGLNPDGAKVPTDIELVFVNHKLPT